ncbi:ABC transporter permease [Streptomyces griseofuscus]|uniref:ABC transporter permease n=1 Tax=Streptomyces griseofuscus TaxID=146922 RepID=UPI0036B7F41A
MSPLFFGVMVLLMARTDEGPEHRTMAVFGAGLMGFWTVVVFGSAQIFHDMRRNGTLETLVAAPTAVLTAVLPQALVINLLGLVDLAALAVYARTVLGFPLLWATDPQSLLALLVCLLALTGLGVCLSVLFIVARDVYAWTNVLEFPLWILSGLAGTQPALPQPLTAVAGLLPTTWAMDATRRAVAGESVLLPIGVTALLGTGYALAAIPLVGYLQDSARKKATLSLV